MDIYPNTSSCKPGVVKGAVGMIAFILAACTVGPPLYWHITEVFAAIRHPSCPPCICECPSKPLLTMPEDCVKRRAEVSEEAERESSELLMEERKSKEAEALETQQLADTALLEAKKLTSQYQKEADKCNSGMETCEEAREKAEEALLAQKGLTTMWEMRARQRGWKDEEQPLEPVVMVGGVFQTMQEPE